MKGLDALGRRLYEKGRKRGLFAGGSRRVQKDLERLHPGADGKELLADYYGKKISRFLLISLVGLLMAAAVKISAGSGGALKEGGITREEYGEGAREIALSVVLEDGEEKSFSVAVQPRQLTREEAQALYEEFAEGLPDLIRGENSSLEEVSKELSLAEHYTGYPFLVEWISSRPEILTGSGILYEVPEETEILLTAEISYEELVWEEKFTVLAVPPSLTEEEIREQKLKELLTASEQDSRLDKVWSLPDNFDGEVLLWEQKQEDSSLLLAAGAIGAAILIFLMEDHDLHDRLLKKRAQLKQSYPELVQKIALYMGAGLTIRGTFQKLASARGHPIYEELRHTCRELQTGVSEPLAYEHFGRRTGVQEYVRLSTLLIQNLKKGNGALLQRLREEASHAQTEKLQNARRLAEEASTKLLIPMVMFLAVVMIMIMLPAFSSMGV